MQQTQPPQSADTSASRLDQLVAEMSAKFEAGEPVNLSALTADCPELRERLEMLLPTLQAVIDFKQSLGGDVSSATATRTAGADPLLGILGDYRIVREIGRGGMGVVYEAEQISLGRRVALKVLPFAAMLDKQQLNRFKNEARAAGTLEHPNIVAIHSVGVERSVHFYAMQFIEGQSLAQMVAALRERAGIRSQESPNSAIPHSPFHTPPSPLPAPTAETATLPRSTLPDFSSNEFYRAIARLGIQAAQALDHAHRNGIVHRDIKPANLLVDDTNKLWVTDFGLARIEADAGMTMTGDILGTLRYMSPEQALAKRVVVDHRCDIYSLGMTLYELLALRPAFAGDDRQELLRQIAFDEPRNPRRFNPRIPEELETIVLKAIEKNPADRYSTSQELADDLQRFLDSKPIKARAASPLQRLVKWTRRHRAVTWATSLALLFSALVVAASLGWIAHRIADMEDSGRNVVIATDLAERGQFVESGEEFYRAFIKNVGDHNSGMWSACMALEYGDRSRYDEVLQKMFDRYRSTNDPLTARRVCWTGLMAPGKAEDLAEMHRLAYHYLDPDAYNTQERALAAEVRALIAYREGKWQEAIEWCEKSRKTQVHPSIDAQLLLIDAMSLHQLGQRDQAQAAYDKAAALIQKFFPKAPRGMGGQRLGLGKMAPLRAIAPRSCEAARVSGFRCDFGQLTLCSRVSKLRSYRL